MLACLVPLAGVYAYGTLRLSDASNTFVPDVRLRIVQAAIDQRQKSSSNLREANVARHLALSVDTPGFESVTHTIWPETAVPFLLEYYQDWRLAVSAAAPSGGVLITGALRGRIEAETLTALWNSLIAVGPGGAIVGTSDKFHLVPFGEYVPLRRFLPFLNKITSGDTDFSAAPGPKTMRLPGLPPVGTLICYEVIFPGAVLDRADRPEWLINLTNDGWFGISTGPYQHFAAARLRSVEEGVPLVRAANTGISAVIDPYGRVVDSLGLGRSGVLDASLPRPLPDLTLYARFGDWSFFALAAAVAALAAGLRLAQPRNSEPNA
jgi:apolipoprotein N-acyltransferase